MEHDRDRPLDSSSHSGGNALLGRVVSRVFDFVAGFVRTGTDGFSDRIIIGGETHRQVRSRNGAWAPLMHHVNNGLYKIDQARRVAASRKKYHGAVSTIRLTLRAIRRSPRHSRKLFQGYGGVLRDARRRLHSLHSEIAQTERHLRNYNPNALREELAAYESRLAAAPSASTRAELEIIVEARRDLLDSVLSLQGKLHELGHQLDIIANAIEVNHIRVVSISSRSGSQLDNDRFAARIHEAGDQLAFLEQSLRELQG
ncbi:MAG: hypothetical protein JST22_11760 [Bacteroidetes bacterium]|nr:hypothetical protein [Bacteroidota bacterium]